MTQWKDAKVYWKLSKNRQLAAALRLLDSLELRPGETILDIGCGTGGACLSSWERIPNGKIIGLDISWEMISVANEELVKRRGMARQIVLDNEPGRSSVERSVATCPSFVQGDAVTLPFRSSSIDVALMTSTLHWLFPHQQECIRETYRALKAGGRLGIEWFTKLYAGHKNHLDDLVSTVAVRLRLSSYLEVYVPFELRFLTLGELHDLLVKVGFGPILIESSPYTVRYANGEEAVKHWTASFGSYLYELLPQQYRGLFLSELVNEVNARRNDHPYEVRGLKLYVVAQKQH